MRGRDSVCGTRVDSVLTNRRSSYGYAVLMSNILSPSSPKVRRKGSTRRPRAGSHLPPFTQDSHDGALAAIRAYLKGRTCYDTFPVSFRLIVLDSKLEVKKALQCLLVNGALLSVSCAYSPHAQRVPQAWFPHRCGTAKSLALRACSPCPTSSTSSSTITNARPTMTLLPMLKHSV